MDHWQADLETGDIDNEVAFVELWYPNVNKCTTLDIGLMSVRASDGIRIKYDFERDGWVILQASIFEWDADDKECDSDYQEVAFVKSWAREENES